MNHAARISGVCLAALMALSATAAEPEKLSSFRAAAVVPADIKGSDDYTIDAVVNSDGYLYQYVIRSRFGNFEAHGESMLRTRTHEIGALAELEKNSKYGAVVDGAVTGLIEVGKSPFELAGSIARRPVETVAAIPSGVGRMFSRTYRAVKGVGQAAGDAVRGDSGADGEVSSSTAKAVDLSNQWLGVTASERRWAKRLNVDPYSSNQVLNKAIKDIARYDAAGRFATGLAVPGVGAIKMVRGVTELVWEMDPYELRKHNEELLIKAGFDSALIDAFHAHAWFSPTMQTVIVNAILSMDGVSKRRIILEKLQAVDSEDEARFAAESIAMLAQAHQAATPLVAIKGAATMPIGVSAKGTSVIYLALDHVVWTNDVADGFAPFLDVPTRQGGDMYLTGTLSDRAQAELNEAGWRTHQRSDPGS